MEKIIIDEEFRFLLPALDSETFTRLEENLLENGCRDALVLWRGILIDGYNRYTICTKHGILYNTVEKEFESREDVIIWIISNQVSRRNLTPIQLTHFRGVHYRAEKKTQAENSRFAHKNANRQNDGLQKSTAKHLSEKYQVSPRTIERDFKTAAAIDAIGQASPEAKRKILAGEVKIDRKTLKEFSSMQEDELTRIAEKIEEGVFEKTSHISDADKIKDKNHNANTSSYTKPQTIDTLIARITGGQYFDLVEFTKNDVSAAAKAALRYHIDMLEDLYRYLNTDFH